MLAGLTAIVLFEVAGDLLQTWLQLPIPGPVIGMALLLLALIANGRLSGELDSAATGLLSYLQLMFVPAGVGIIAHVDLLCAHWRALSVALVVSSILTIVVTGLVMRGVERAQQPVQIPVRAASIEGAE